MVIGSLKMLLMMKIILYCHLSIVDGNQDISLYSNVSYSPRHHYGNNRSSRYLIDDQHQVISTAINTSIVINTRPFIKDDRSSSHKQIDGQTHIDGHKQIDIEYGHKQIDLHADLQRAAIAADFEVALVHKKAITNIQHHAFTKRNPSREMNLLESNITITIGEALQGRYHVATDSLLVVDNVKDILMALTINSTFEQMVILWLCNESDLRKCFDRQEENHSRDPVTLYEIVDVLDTIKDRLQQQQRAQIERNRLTIQVKDLEIAQLKKQQQTSIAAMETDQLHGTSLPHDVAWQLLHDERTRSSSLQDQVHSLQSQLNKFIDDSKRGSVYKDDILQKKLEDERMNATILQQQVHSLELHIMNLTSAYMSSKALLENNVLKLHQLYRNQTVQLTNLEEDIINCEMRCHAIEDQLWSRQMEFDQYQSIVNRSKVEVTELKKAELTSQIKIGNSYDDIIASKDLQIQQLQQRLLNQSIILLERQQQQKQHLDVGVVYLPSPPPTICGYIITPNGSIERPSMMVDNSRNTMRKNVILESIVESAKAIGDMINFEQWSTAHTSSSQVIFTCALSHNYFGAKLFAGTARKSGFTGDIVVAVLPAFHADFLTYLKLFKTTVYTAPLTCSKMKRKFETSCDFLGEHLPLTLIRSFIYQYWALKYPDTTYIMMSDFRDVFFQSNPFTLKNKFPDWGPSAYDLIFSAEHHPNRVVSRCPHTSALFMNCYGKFLLDQIGASTILNNGVFFATRNASLIYNYLILEQRHEHVRNSLATNFTSNNKYCYSTGVDQAFHNYLFYSGDLHNYFKIKVFPQGEGPINTLGGFYGSTKILRASLSDWRLLRGEGKFKYVYNWNGEISPVVHQLDRFLATELQGGFQENLAVLQNHRLKID